MASYNKVLLIGRLARDCETRFAQTGSAITKTALCVNKEWKNEAGEKKEAVTFVDIVFFGKRGEAFARFHQKGSHALIEGELRTDHWKDKATGANRSKLYVVVDNWQFVGDQMAGPKNGFQRSVDVEGDPEPRIDEATF